MTIDPRGSSSLSMGAAALIPAWAECLTGMSALAEWHTLVQGSVNKTSWEAASNGQPGGTRLWWVTLGSLCPGRTWLWWVTLVPQLSPALSFFSWVSVSLTPRNPTFMSAACHRVGAGFDLS